MDENTANAQMDSSADACPNSDQDPKDRIVMESGGTIDADCPNYVEEDDVKDSIAEGYF